MQARSLIRAVKGDGGDSANWSSTLELSCCQVSELSLLLMLDLAPRDVPMQSKP